MARKEESRADARERIRRSRLEAATTREPTAEPAILAPAKGPDRLVAFMWLLEQDGVDVQGYVNRATEINLAEVPTIPEVRENEELTAEHSDATRVHDWALAVSGSTAKVRQAVSQLGVSDGETNSHFDGSLQPDRIGELVAEVADRRARELADEEAAS
jgi:hypothetical protein